MTPLSLLASSRFVVLLYALLAVAFYVTATFVVSDYWDVPRAVGAGFWVVATAVLLFRRSPIAWVLLLSLELVALGGFMEWRGPWYLFLLQVVLLALIASPAAVAYTPDRSGFDASERDVRRSRVLRWLLVGCLLVAAVAMGIALHPGALAALALAVFFGLWTPDTVAAKLPQKWFSSRRPRPQP